MHKSLATLLSALLPALALAACASPKASTAASDQLAAASIARGSDPRAVTIAGEVMHALGGRAAWDRARVLEWNFFGRRSHVWDKWTGDYRLDDGKKVILMNLNTGAGRVFEDGVEVVDEAQRAKELSRARSIWINDSYWLVMPYKLLDPGVKLADAGQKKLGTGQPADVIRLTFDAVGDTPRNAYEVFVTQDTRRVAEWAYFEDQSDAEPKLASPWAGWKDYGGIQLCGDRGPKREITAIAVLDAPPTKLHAP
ncbi:MAG: hypothetical protein NTY35_17895 [Planctomycetota bacterium]|nr:hypothetical protein [Planctomycetota bacterium]